MAKYFPKLNQRRVRIDMSDSESVMVDMLPISELATLEAFTERIAGIKDAAGYGELRKDMVAVAKKVIPDPFSENLARFSVEMLIELLAYLVYGDGDDQPKQEAEDPKN
ncbi:MAG: hypothetical protein AB7F40_04340 [Victivallaceae bacterium]